MCRSSYTVHRVLVVDVRQHAAVLIQAAWKGHQARRRYALARLHRTHKQTSRGGAGDARLQRLYQALSQGSAGLRQGIVRDRRTWGA